VGGCQPFAGALNDQFPLKLGDRGEDVKRQPVCGRGAVDILGQGAKPGIAGTVLLDKREKILERASQPVILCHNDHNFRP